MSSTDEENENEFASYYESSPACFSLMAFSNDDDDDGSDDDDNDDGNNAHNHSRRNQQAEQDSLAASNALVGENLVDSPAPKQRAMKRGYHNNNNNSNNLPPLPSLPPLQATSGVSSNTMNRQSQQQQQPPPQDDSNLSVGIMAHGLAWVQRTRDSRRRRYLQHQAEQQLLKIQQAQQQLLQDQQDAAAATPYSMGLFQNSTFQSIMSVPGAIHSQNDNNNTTNSSKTAGVNHTNKKKNHMSQASSSLAADTSGGESRRNLQDRHRRSETDMASAVISQSGSGYSFNIPLADDDAAKTEEEEADFIPPVRVQEEPDLAVQPFVLSPHEMQQIAKHVLPTGIAYCKWTRLYSLVRDGDSFDACLRLVQDHAKTLMVVRTSRNQVLGGFADMPWRIDSGGASYYGGPEACLFKIVTVENGNDDDSNNPQEQRSTVKAFKWTGNNRYIQLCDHAHKMLAFGGGGEEGAFGLSVEKDFLLGSTGPCATFENEPLCDQDTFEIVDLEIYGFLIGQF